MTEQELFDKVFVILYEMAVDGSSAVDATYKVVDIARQFDSETEITGG